MVKDFLIIKNNLNKKALKKKYKKTKNKLFLKFFI